MADHGRNGCSMSQEQIESLGLHDWQKNDCRLATIRSENGGKAPKRRTEFGFEVETGGKERKRGGRI